MRPGEVLAFIEERVCGIYRFKYDGGRVDIEYEDANGRGQVASGRSLKHAVAVAMGRDGDCRRSRSEEAAPRHAQMEAAYRAGKTLREIAAEQGVTYQRVQQVLRKRGVTKWDRPHRIEVEARR